ncbi:LLM class flavin-dependent oxidoreductase [Nonomuraea sp. NPDC026600]|uniref:LLM class flavin-dependent oxidoreductase n=1 Tax=Nonomuraea sp. NPDC026600 TaxID=3155363 RepID=UPI0033F6A17C
MGHRGRQDHAGTGPGHPWPDPATPLGTPGQATPATVVDQALLRGGRLEPVEHDRGELADGTVTTWTGAAAIAGHIAPRITEAARAAGRPAPRIVASALVAVTDDPQRVRDQVAERFGFAASFASYRSLLELQGLSGLHETVIAGDEGTVDKEIGRFAEAGATDFLASPVGDEGDQARTLAFVRDRLATAPW